MPPRNTLKSESPNPPGSEIWNIDTPAEGLHLLRLKGLKILCWTVLLVVPVLFARDLFASEMGSDGPVVKAVVSIRCLVLLLSAYVLVTIRRGQSSTLRPVPFAHVYFTLLIVMVLLTIVKLGGSSSPVYAGLVTVMFGWCYFFVFGLTTTIPIFVLVVLGYLGVLGVFVSLEEMLSGEAILRASLLCAVGLLVCIAGSTYRREQNHRFEAIIKQRDLAGHDPLTQVLNRFALRERYQAALDRATRHGRCLSLLIIDIDDFKKINDAQGHAVGDDVLRNIATILETESQDQGQVGRWGGEEFVLILPGFGRDAAEKVAETIRHRCEITPFKSPWGNLKITISIGISSLEGRDSELAHLVTEADRALYKAKADGKNRVCSTLLGSDSPETDKDVDMFPAGTVRQLTDQDVDDWMHDLTFRGYSRFAAWTAVTLIVVALLALQVGAHSRQGLTSFSYSELSIAALIILALSYGLARLQRGYSLIRTLHFVVPIAIAALFASMAAATGGSTSPAFILVMAVLILSSFTSPGGWRSGLPTFALICAAWPLTMISLDEVHSTKSLIVRSTIIAVLGIVCTLAHELFHQIRYQAERLDRHLDLMGTTDSLTGIENRRAFDERFKHECAVALREKSALSLVFVDMNELKRINDSFGHLAGDKALRKLVSVMREFVRSSDIVARLGGDEFAVLLPETKLEGAVQLMDRIDKQLDVERVALTNKEFEVTAACGVAQLDPDASNVEDELKALTKRADSALYAAKGQKGTAIGIHDGSDIELIELWKNVHPVQSTPTHS